jgi:hypothetical protein
MVAAGAAQGILIGAVGNSTERTVSRKFKVLGTGLLLIAIALPGAAWAQDSGVRSIVERTTTSTPKEKLDYAAESNDEMRTSVKAVNKMLEAARREQDVVKIQCLNNRLTSLRALLQVSEAAEARLQEALNDAESERAEHEYRKIAVARDKASQILAEAERCAGDAGAADGSTQVTVTGELELEDDPTTADAVDELDVDFDPPETSPFQ